MRDLSAFKESVRELSDLLEDENVCLRSAEFELLKEIADRKLTLVRELETFLDGAGAGELDDEARAALVALDKLTVHNGALLKAAYNGSLAAQGRLDGLRHDQASVGAYSASGKSIVSSEAIISRQRSV